MDYKEKYEMALEGIQEILGSGEDSIKMSRLHLRLQGIFPELIEPEDERIRKELINYFIKGKEYLSLCSFSKEEILAWLEKQYADPNKEYWRGYREGMKDILDEYDELKRMLDKYDELKRHGDQSKNNFPSFDESQGTIVIKGQCGQILANSCQTCKDEQESMHYEL